MGPVRDLRQIEFLYLIQIDTDFANEFGDILYSMPPNVIVGGLKIMYTLHRLKFWVDPVTSVSDRRQR